METVSLITMWKDMFACFANKIHLEKSVLILMTLLSLWIIVVVGMNLPCKVIVSMDSINTDKVNTILVNFSYSYLAGTLFYILTSYLPRRRAKKEIITGMKIRMDTIDNIFNSIIRCLAFENEKIDTNDTQMINKLMYDKQKFEELFKSVDWNVNSKYCQIISMGIENKTYLKYIAEEHERLQLAITFFISTYKEYLSAAQLSMLEEIRGAFLITVLSTEKNATTFTKEGVDVVTTWIFDELHKLRKLKHSISPKLDNWKNN